MYTPNLSAHCYWCTKRSLRKEMYKLRDGPIDWWFCDAHHSQQWCRYRQQKPTARLCRMLPQERQRYLNGRTMEDAISSLCADALAAGGESATGVRDLLGSQVSVCAHS